MSRVTGLRETLKAFEMAGRKSKRAVAAALYAEGLDILGKSVLECPYDMGRLRQSAYCAPPTSDESNRPVVEIGYGVTYAVPVHERTEAHHPTGKAKFLSDPVNAARAGFVGRVATRARDYLKQGIGVDAIPASAPTRPKEG